MGRQQTAAFGGRCEAVWPMPEHADELILPRSFRHKRFLMIDVPLLIQRQPFTRPPLDLVQAFRDTPTGFIVDAMGGSGALDHRLRPAVAEQYAFCGVALTVDAGPGDNLALVHALQDVQPGDVLMAATGGHTGCAITGDLVLGIRCPPATSWWPIWTASWWCLKRASPKSSRAYPASAPPRRRPTPRCARVHGCHRSWPSPPPQADPS
jgi:hypothetical protein